VRSRLREDFFERLYREAPDPWDFASSPYEAAKYDATLQALGDRRWHRALEIGCSIGVLTARLAERCDALLAVDVSDTALAQARERVAGRGNVTVERREIPEAFPAGEFDLVVCSEVLYYLDPPGLDATVAGLRHAVVPGGSVLAVHWRPATQRYPFTGDEVHARLADGLGWPAAVSERHERYALDRFDRPAYPTGFAGGHK